MKNRLSIKLLALVAVLVLLQFPLTSIKQQVSERKVTRAQTVAEISDSWGGKQHIIGPIMVVPYTETLTEKVWDKNLEKYVEVEKEEQHELVILPETSTVHSNVDVTERQRSIYSAPVYTAKSRFKGRFDLSRLASEDWAIGTPEMIFMLSDLSSVLTIPTMTLNKDTLTFVEGGYKSLTGIKAEIPNWQSTVPYDLEIDLKGSQRLSTYPLAKNNEVSIQSNWQHPSFDGDFLPESHQIAEDGFIAKWRTTSLSSNASQLIELCAQRQCQILKNASFGVTFFEPVNHYTKSSRATKYAMLFILTTFAIFFVLEAMKSAAVHPIQYFLVGLALTVFNLLLVALSEHFGFLLSYALSSVACLVLMTVYAIPILKRTSWVFGFSAMLTIIYILMYFILLSEDLAFLMGSGFLFIVLATLMITTRHVDWYELMKSPERPELKRRKRKTLDADEEYID